MGIPGFQNSGEPLLATQEMLQTLGSANDLPENIIDIMDNSPDFMVENHPDAPMNNHANTQAAMRFRNTLEAAYPGITKKMKELSGASGMDQTPQGRRRLILLGVAEWLRDHGRP